jgi:hypothetical protein
MMVSCTALQACDGGMGLAAKPAGISAKPAGISAENLEPVWCVQRLREHNGFVNTRVVPVGDRSEVRL